MRLFLTILIFTSMGFAGTEYGSFDYEGRVRDYIVFVPEDRVPGLPLVFNLHGYGMEASDMPDISYMNSVADTGGFVVVYPNAVGKVWNSGIDDDPSWPAPDVDDVGFLSVLIDTLQLYYGIDTNRVYSCGFSNGGFMSFRLAVELGDRIQKIASVVGVITPTVMTAADSASPIPVLCILSTADPIVPFSGAGLGWYSGPETIDFWLQHNMCSMPVDSLILPDIDPLDGCRAVLFPYSSEDRGATVIYYRIEGGGHKWPSGSWYSYGGPMNFDINASEEIWNFFKDESYSVQGVWANDLTINKTYTDPAGDSLIVNAQITNTDDYSYSAYAVLREKDSTLVDSFQLFDDGLHYDDDPGDGMAGAILPAPNYEDHFYLQVTSLNLDENEYLEPHDLERFTTAGPLSIINIDMPYDSIPDPGDRILFSLSLLNVGSDKELSNVKASISSLDTFVTDFPNFLPSFGNLAPGDTAKNTGFFFFTVSENCPNGHEIPIQVAISSDGIIYWMDEFVIKIGSAVGIADGSSSIPIGYSLYQNFPNPFNPSTTIRYDLQEQSEVILTVYDIQGREVKMLKHQTQSAGHYEVLWEGVDELGNPVSTGVYFARLQAGDYSQTIKMVYLK